MSQTPYLYGELNKQIEKHLPKIISEDDIVRVVHLDNTDDKIGLSVDIHKLVQLQQIRKDINTIDDTVKYYALFGYNADTQRFDIQLGDQIVVDTSSTSTGIINSAKILVGTKSITLEDGTVDVVPVYADVKLEQTEGGNIVLSEIPVSGLVDTYYDTDLKQEFYLSSIIDGNPRGEVY